MSDDLIVFARGPELQVVRFDPVGRTLVGVPQTLVSAVAVVEGRAQFAVSTSGSLLYVLHGSRAADPRLAWWLGPGSEQPAPALDIAGAPRLSNDGRRLAWVGSSDGARADVRLSDLERGAVTRLTHDGLSSSPVWSGDGQHVYYARRDDRLFHVVSIDADGGRSTSMAPGAGHMFPGSVSGDGQVLATTVAGRETKRDIWITSTSGASPPRAIAQSPFDEAAPSLSRDGSLVAYESDESGRWDVYVQRISDGRRVIVSTAGGEEPFWAVDGSAIMYRAGMALMRASLDSRTLTVGSPATLGELRGDVPLGIAPDGRILIDRRSGLAGSSAAIALHWDREARRLLGPPAGAMPR
jgi:hypothetical protein